MTLFSLPVCTLRQNILHWTLGLCLCLVGLSDTSFCQVGWAALSGTIVDRTGALVPDANVAVTNEDTNVTVEAKTTHGGVYNVLALKPGTYRIRVSKQGFKQIVISGIMLHTQDSVSRNVTLDIGATSETVTVNASTDHLPTDSATIGVLVNRDFVENMPLNGRSFQDLIALAPGAVSANDFNNPGLFSINGQHDNSNYYIVDGVAANINPNVGQAGIGNAQGLAGTLPGQTALGTTQGLTSVDDLQEFKIQTAGYSAEYGRSPGGQVELTTRSGTNSLHGSVFDYFRNDALDAKDWFFDNQGIPKQAERQNDFGGTVGGPLNIPRLYNGKNRTFYFVSYEGLRLRLPAFSGIADVPTIAFRQAAAPGIQPFLNAMPIPNGKPENNHCLSTLGSAYSALSCSAQWSAGYSNPSSVDAFSARVDQTIGQRLQLFGRYSDTPSDQGMLSTSFPGEFVGTSNRSRTWTLGATTRLWATVLDELRFNVSVGKSFYQNRPDAFSGAVPYPISLLVPTQYAPAGTVTSGAFAVSLPTGELFEPAGYQTIASRQRQYNLVDNLSLSRGKHLLKVGADYRRLVPMFAFPQYGDLLAPLSPQDVQQGNASFGLITAAQPAHPIFNNVSTYIQDHWLVTSRLSIDAGLRWEYNPAPGTADGIYPLAITTGDLSQARLASRNTPQYQTTYKNFAPRFGFAYSVLPPQHGTLVARGGVGVFYDTGQSTAAGGYLGGSYPFSVQTSVQNILFPLSAAAVTPPSLNFPLTPPYGYLNGLNDPNLRLPYTVQWNLALDRSLSQKNTLTASYVGNAGRRLLFTGIYPNLGAINPLFTSIRLTSNAASSSYNALQVQDRGYIAPGVQLIASYAWAHAVDNASNDQGASSPVRGNSDNDVRHVFNLALNCRNEHGLSGGIVRAMTTGWSFDNRFTAQSGYPLDLQVGSSILLPDGAFLTERPDLVPGATTYLHNVPDALGGWRLNPDAFTGLVGDGRNPPGTIPVDANGNPLRQGTLPRNWLHGPAFWNLNTAVQRTFALHEQLHLVFRVEAFNIFNHPNAGGILTYLAASTFGESNSGNTTGGQPTIGAPNQLYGTGAARSLQLMLRVQF